MESNFVELLVQANQLMSKHKWEDAAIQYQQAQEIIPDNSHIIAKLAECYFHLGARVGGFDKNSKQAISLYKQALKLDPTSAELYYLLGNCYELLELDYKKSVKYFKRALDFNPNYVPALVAAALHYKDPEETVTISESIEWLERAASIRVDDGNIYHNLGCVFIESGRYEEAKKALLRALLCTGSLDPEAVTGVGKLLIKFKWDLPSTRVRHT